MTTTTTARRPHICRLTVKTTKTAAPQPVAFIILQDADFPYIDGHMPHMSWRNGPTFPTPYPPQPPTVAQIFKAYQLRADLEPEDLPADWNRNHLAGYTPYKSAHAMTEQKPNPGAIIYRGQTLGELSVEIQHPAHLTGPAIWSKVRDFTNPTPGESAFIKEQIAPALLAFIAANRPSLHAEAVETTAAHVAKLLKDTRERLDELETKAAQALAALEAITPKT